MSYDSYFYRKKGKGLTEKEIRLYLNQNLVEENEHGNEPYHWPKGTFSFKKINKSTPAEEVAWVHTNTFRTNDK